jgi:hypothetical protein
VQEASKTQTTKLQVCRHTQRLRKPERRSSRCAKTPGVIKNSKIEPPGVQRPIENAKLEPPGMERHPEPLKTKKSSLQVCRDTRSRRKPKKRTSRCAETPGAVENPKIVSLLVATVSCQLALQKKKKKKKNAGAPSAPAMSLSLW